MLAFGCSRSGPEPWAETWPECSRFAVARAAAGSKWEELGAVNAGLDRRHRALQGFVGWAMGRTGG